MLISLFISHSGLFSPMVLMWSVSCIQFPRMCGPFLVSPVTFCLSMRNRTLGPPLENNPEIPPSSRDEGLRLLHGLATNLATSLQTPQEA